MQTQMNQLNGYRAVNITASEGLRYGPEEGVERPKHSEGEFSSSKFGFNHY